MLRTSPILSALLLVILLLGCSNGDGLRRVEVRGTVTHQGKPVERGMITFRPSSGASGPSAGTGIVSGTFEIPRDCGPTTGPHEVDIAIVTGDGNSLSLDDSILNQRSAVQLTTFSQHVELTNEINELEFTLPNR